MKRRQFRILPSARLGPGASQADGHADSDERAALACARENRLSRLSSTAILRILESGSFVAAPRLVRPVRSGRATQPKVSPARLAAPPPAEPRPPSPGDDRHARFARMVFDHVEAGLLRMTARRRLMLLAEGLGIGAFKANLIIAEVLHDVRLGRRRPGADVTGPLTAPAQPTRHSPAWRILLAALLALLIDAALVYLLH